MELNRVLDACTRYCNSMPVLLQYLLSSLGAGRLYCYSI